MIESAKDYVEFDKDFVPPTDTDPVKYININNTNKKTIGHRITNIVKDINDLKS